MGLIIVGFVMIFILLRNSRRPKIEVRIDEIKMRHGRQDKKKEMIQHKHAFVKYNYEGQDYEAWILLKTKKSVEGEWIKATVSPKDHGQLTAYAPKKEQIAIAVVFAVGIFLTGGSWWVMDYMDWW